MTRSVWILTRRRWHEVTPTFSRAYRYSSLSRCRRIKNCTFFLCGITWFDRRIGLPRLRRYGSDRLRALLEFARIEFARSRHPVYHMPMPMRQPLLSLRARRRARAARLDRGDGGAIPGPSYAAAFAGSMGANRWFVAAFSGRLVSVSWSLSVKVVNICLSPVG